MMAKRVGRPVQASQTVDEAVARYLARELPSRPRNAIERDVMRQRRGPKKKPNAPTHVAAQYAVYLVRGGMPMREAARKAAETYRVKPDSVRKPARKLLHGPQVRISVEVNRQWAGLMPDNVVTAPLLVKVADRFEDLP